MKSSTVETSAKCWKLLWAIYKENFFLFVQVVVTNQITTRFVGAGSGAGNSLNGVEALQDVDGADAEPEEEDGSHVTAALGNTWSHAVNTRLIVQYLDDKFRQVKIERNPRFFF